jgi:hypothetical protein
MVQSARVQKFVVGDDVVLSHQIMEDKAYDAEKARAPVTVNSGDVVTCFYPLADPDAVDLIGYLGSPVGSLPSSEITVAIPGVIPAVPPVPQRGTSTFLVGLGTTVRIEIIRISNGAKETHYLYNEVDILERGFPERPMRTDLT